jgi:peptidoglycan hydrolase-like protein with peptidoglycan-binding domain
MAMRIARSVGKSGVNLPNDVQVVQHLLNKAGPEAGGPTSTLMVDGRCGPMTNQAIKSFQVRQFGLGFADGRVDPNGRTIARLNDFDTSEPPLTTSSILRCPHGGEVKCTPTGPPRIGQVSGGTPLMTTDPGVVAGCMLPTPCVRVQWVPAPTLTLTARSIGLCMSAAGVPQGSVVITKV